MNADSSSKAATAPQRAVAWKTNATAVASSAAGKRTLATGTTASGTPKAASAVRDPARVEQLAYPRGGEHHREQQLNRKCKRIHGAMLTRPDVRSPVPA